MGKDKFENEDLIKYGWDTDVWFHVDKLSSAHVYLRLYKDCTSLTPDGKQAWECIPEDLLVDCAQLTKANSIEGNKKNNLTIIYTPWSNLKKTADMDTGQVAFHKNKMVKKVHIQERVNDIVNRLNKTKSEEYPELEQERIQFEKQRNQEKRMIAAKEKSKQIKQQQEYQKQKEAKSYDHVFKELKSTNQHDFGGKNEREAVEDFEEDFM
jgi:hypothetical protein